MLYDEPVLYFKGLTIFRDFSQDDRFYFHPPEAPRIARSAEGGNDYAMRLVLYRPDPNFPAPQGFENGGGFLNLDVDLKVDESVIEEAEQELGRRFGGRATLVPTPFMSGSVELILLGVGKEDEGQPFVRKVAGSAVPSLYGTQRAAFSVVLDRDGAALMSSVIKEGGATMALALYHLTYAGIGPAYNLKITVDYERVYEHLDLRVRAGLTASSGGSSFVGKAGFHMLMEELREKRAIKVEETDPIPGENGRTPVDQARIDGIIGNLMGSKWFKPSLSQAAQTTNLGAGASGTSGGGSGSGSTTPSTGSGAAQGQRRRATWAEDSRTPATFPTDRGIGPFAASSRGTKETLTIRGDGATAKTGESATALQSATIQNGRLEVEVPDHSTRHVEIKWPAVAGGSPGTGERQRATWTSAGTETPDRGVEPFQASSSGNSETLVIRGAGATAKVGDSAASVSPVTLQGGNRLVVPVGNDETKHVEITWEGEQGRDDTFFLFFDYDRPRNAADVRGYIARSPNPDEPAPPVGTPPGGEQARFKVACGAQSREDDGSPRGLAALDDWLNNAIEPRQTLQLQSHASYEGDDRQPKRNSNMALSGRRREVAEGLIAANSNGYSTGPTPPDDRGHQDALAARANPTSFPTLANDSPPLNGRDGDPRHRVVLIRGTLKSGQGQVLRGTLHRPQPGTTPGTAGKPECTLKGHLTRPERGGGGGRGDTTIQASFEINLEMIEREERLTATYELSTRKARTQEIHPQGQLLLDAVNPEDYIIEADGAIDFFQWLDVAASTTAQWQQEGINSIHVELRYAPREEGGFRRSNQIVLTPEKETDSWRTGVLRENEDDSDSPVLHWYEYRVTVHYLPDVALGDQSGAVTSIGAEGADEQGWIRTTARNLVIHPRDVTPAITVNVTSGIMRFDLLQRVQVVLAYGPYRQNLTLSAETPEHRLIIRPEEGLEDEALKTTGTLFYKDGAQVQLAEEEWQPQELIVINEPRENVLRVQIVLADPGDDYERVEVRLKYEHGNRLVEESRTLTDHAQLEEWAVRLEDPAERGWQYQLTAIKKSGDIDTVQWTDGTEEQLIVGVKAVDVIPVEVTWLIPPAGDFLAVKVDLRYEDQRNGILWEHSELIRGEHPGNFKWSIAIANPRLRTYQYKVTEFHRTGQQAGEWTDSGDLQLVLLPSD